LTDNQLRKTRSVNIPSYQPEEIPGAKARVYLPIFFFGVDMNKLSIEKTMTVKEIIELLGYDPHYESQPINYTINYLNYIIKNIKNKSYELKKELLKLSLNIMYEYMPYKVDCNDNSYKNYEYSKQQNKKYKFVYIAKHNDFYKIGRTNNLNRRFKTMRTGNPIIILIASRLVENNIILENELHNKFKDKHFKGEWYLLEEKDLDILTNIYGFMYAL